jgi:hypothetical protein
MELREIKLWFICLLGFVFLSAVVMAIFLSFTAALLVVSIEMICAALFIGVMLWRWQANEVKDYEREESIKASAQSGRRVYADSNQVRGRSVSR